MLKKPLKKSRVHILLFSERKGGARRVSLSKILGGAALVATTLIAGTAGVSFIAFNHFFKPAPMVVQVPVEAPSISKEDRDRLLGKLSELESELDRGAQFTDRLQTMIDVETGEINVGRGGANTDSKSSKYINKKGGLTRVSTEAWSTKGAKEDDNFLRLLSDQVSKLRERRHELEDRINQLYLLNEGRVQYSLSIPDRWPVKGWLTSNFGFRRSPFSGSSQFHAGLDIASPMGTEVVAPSDGRVVFSGRRDGYGNTVILDHGFGLQTLYGHNSRLFVKEGDVIKRGARIAAVGNSGRSTGPHLHYEVHVDGVPANPINFINDFMD